jgi:sodium transport system permease protein
MRLPIIKAIYQREMLDMVRDRRTMISMVAVPLVLFPLLFQVMTRVITRLEENADAEAKTMGIAVRITTPSVREALEKTGFRFVEKDNLPEAVEKKEIAAAVEEVPGTPAAMQIYADNSNPTSTAAADKIRIALTELRDQKIREGLRTSGIAESVLTPFTIKRTNVADERKMAGANYGMFLGYIVLLMMFTGGMYAVIDMTAGEKERKTLEALLASPGSRQEIVMGKTLAAITAIIVTTVLMVGSLAYSMKNLRTGPRAGGAGEMMGTIPLDPHTIGLMAVVLIPMAIFAASVMFAIAMFARSFKEGQSYLTPITLLVIFPAFLSGMPGLHITPLLCLIPIFNAGIVMRGILLGDISTVNFVTTLAANLLYAAIAFTIATRTFERESVLFRS